MQWQVQNLPEFEQNKRFNDLHDMCAPEAMKIILDMGGFYIKIGQMGRIRDDFVPPQYMKGLKTLQSDVTYQPISYVKKDIFPPPPLLFYFFFFLSLSLLFLFSQK